MGVALFVLLQLASIVGVKALVKKYPADPEMARLARHERRVDEIKAGAQVGGLPMVE